MTSATGTVWTYEIIVAAHLDEHWSARLGGLALDRHADGTSTLVGPLADQAQLHGVLAAIRDLGVTLLALRVLDRADPDAASGSKA